MDNMLTHITDPASNKKVKLMTKASDYKANDADTIHAFVIIEGLHCFNGEAPVDSGEGQEQLINNMKDFLSRDDCKVLAINLSHLQNDGIANHAFGLKLFDEKLFFPTGDGLNMPLAQEVIDEIYSRNIIIDIKHLSIKARQQFYDLRNNNPSLPPIICTHAGLTGIEKHDAQFYAKRPKLVGDMFAIENFKPLGWLEKTSFNVSKKPGLSWAVLKTWWKIYS